MFVFPLWLLASMLAGVASNIFNFISRYLLKGKSDPIAFAWYVEALRIVIFAFALLFDYRFLITPYSIFILLCIGLSEMFAVYFFMKMHAYSHLSISTIISRTRMIWVPIIAFFLIQETLSPLEYIGIAVLFLGISIVSSPKKFFVDKGAKYANISAFLIALNIVFAKMATPYASNSVIFIAYGIPTLFIFPLLMKQAKKRLLDGIKEKFSIKVTAVLLNTLSMYLFIVALRLGEAGKVTAVYQGMLILSVLAGIFLLKEQENIPKKLIGTAITVIGVVVLSLQ
jgi:drug/metabolite transporter (DMT)-like permease